jgi:hypothetical protein
MKCDQVLSSLATGSAVARWRARRHVARCVRCAEAQIQLREITQALAEAPPLTAAQRANWTAASTEPTASRPRRAWVYGAGLMAATVLLGAIGLKLWGPQPVGGAVRLLIARMAPQPPAPSPVQPSEHGNLANEMLAKVDRLDHELAELRREGDLLDVRKDADALWNRYAHHKPSTF